MVEVWTKGVVTEVREGREETGRMRAGAFVADRGLTTGSREIGFAAVSPAHGVIHRPRRVKAGWTWEKRVDAEAKGKFRRQIATIHGLTPSLATSNLQTV
jgi:hypothetical protein